MRAYQKAYNARSEEARSIVLGVLDCAKYDNVPYRLADAWHINSSHLSKLLIQRRLTPTMDDLLVQKGLLIKKPPKDPRQRDWMRIDNVEMAAGKMLQHYDVPQIASGFKATLDPTQLSQLIKQLNN